MKLLLLDGHALAFRSYYAMIRSPLTNSAGENTSAEFGFLRTLLALRRDEAPDAILVAFDPPGGSFRHRDFPDYKAQRAETPLELKASVSRLQEFLPLAGIAQEIRPGYEADDVLASAARRAAAEGWDVRIVSGDKDLCQLVDDRIHLLRPASGKKPQKELGPAEVEEEYGVPPAKIRDYLSLVGDSADNVPGVAGLGPKGSSKLLAEFESLDDLYARLDDLDSATVRKKLEDGRENAFRARGLIALVEDLDLDGPEPAWRPAAPRRESVQAWLLERGFHTLVPDFLGESEPEEAARYSLVQDEASLRALVERLESAPRFAVDTETTGLDPLSDALVGISLALEPGEAFYLPVAGRCAGEGLPLETLQSLLGPALADPGIEKVAQNLKFDAQMLEQHGLPIQGACFDTMLASYCVDPGRRSHGLDALALELLGHVMVPFEDLFEAGDKTRDIQTVPLDSLGHYAAEDADYTLRLAATLRPALGETGTERVFRELEMPLIPVLSAMEKTGIALDTAHLARLSGEMETARAELEGRIHAAAGREFAIGSPKQLATVLFEELGLPKGRRTKTGYSTDEQVLGELAAEHPIAGWVLEWRELSKLKSTYVDVLPQMVLPATGRVHTRFNQAVAATGRLSSSDPNLQNIPIRTALGREIRRAFVPAQGMQLASFDYSQVELRILAALSGDAALGEAFAGDRDIHRWTAARLAGKAEDDVTREERDRSKVVNYGVLYGMGAHGLAQRLRISRGEAQGFIDEYFAAFPEVRRWIDETLFRARAEGAVTTLFGRRRALPELNSGNGRIRGFAERMAVNTPIQGSAADLIKLAMIRIHDWLPGSGLDARMLLQVHDELLFEVAPGDLEALSGEVVARMEGVGQGIGAVNVTLKVDWGVGASWLEAH